MSLSPEDAYLHFVKVVDEEPYIRIQLSSAFSVQEAFWTGWYPSRMTHVASLRYCDDASALLWLLDRTDPTIFAALLQELFEPHAWNRLPIAKDLQTGRFVQVFFGQERSAIHGRMGEEPFGRANSTFPYERLFRFVSGIQRMELLLQILHDVWMLAQRRT